MSMDLRKDDEVKKLTTLRSFGNIQGDFLRPKNPGNTTDLRNPDLFLQLQNVATRNMSSEKAHNANTRK